MRLALREAPPLVSRKAAKLSRIAPPAANTRRPRRLGSLPAYKVQLAQPLGALAIGDPDLVPVARFL